MNLNNLRRYLRRYLRRKIKMKTRRRLENRNIRKLTKLAGGSSYGLTLPIEFVRKLGWKERQKLVVSLYGKRITIKDWEKK